MRRGLAVAAVLLIPFAGLAVGIVAAFRYVFQHDDGFDPNGKTMRRIRKEAAAADKARELQEQLVTLPRTVSDGPTGRYDVEVKRS